jgi:hypothetical protein
LWSYPWLASPAISAGVLFLRGQHRLFAIQPAGAASAAQRTAQR